MNIAIRMATLHLAGQKHIPLRRLGTPEDCATVVDFMATNLSDYVTGQVICVCRGMVLYPS